jgi:hypothetical protein
MEQQMARFAGCKFFLREFGLIVNRRLGYLDYARTKGLEIRIQR